MENSSLSLKELRLFRAAKFGPLEKLRRLIQEEKVDVNVKHPLGWTPLSVAVVNRKTSHVDLLLANGADPNIQDEFPKIVKKFTAPAQRVAVNDREDQFSDFAKLPKTGDGEDGCLTPLMYGALLGSTEICDLLLRNGANPLQEDGNGRTAKHYTKDKNVLAILQEYAAKVIEEKIPTNSTNQKKYVSPLEKFLGEKIIGQQDAISVVASALRRKQLVSGDKRPMVFLFLGSSGVGKTELARQLAYYLHKDKSEALIILDMSEYQHKHDVWKMIGAPPGFVAHEDGGQLTNKLQQCPDAVVVFDEIEKAHPDITTTLLQLFDEGRLTDGKGVRISCKDAIFVMTSNLASDEISSEATKLRKEKADKQVEESIKIPEEFKDKVVEPILKQNLKRYEFLGRIKKIVMKYFIFHTVEFEMQPIIQPQTQLRGNGPPDHELTASQIVIMKQAMNKVRETVQRLATDHRDLHSTVSKVGKAIDRNFVSDFASTSREDVFSGPDKIMLLNQVICQHFYRQGMLDIAQELAQDAGLKTEEDVKEPFTELNRILDCLKQRDLGPALEWAVAHREALEAQNSILEFKLHQLRFIGLIQQGASAQSDAIAYARTHLSQFVHRHEKEIQNLMGMFLYLPHGISLSPYSHLLEPRLWSEIYDIFTRDACFQLGLSVESPLSICINAGCTALPALLNIKQVMQQRQVTGIWNGKDELPIEIDLGLDSRYHSVFACPILRQQSTELNPPMRLVCGHVISRDALNKLGSTNKLKCPYCPLEQNPSEARLIFF